MSNISDWTFIFIEVFINDVNSKVQEGGGKSWTFLSLETCRHNDTTTNITRPNDNRDGRNHSSAANATSFKWARVS